MATQSQRFSLTWVLNLFGTAVGAGVLFCQLMQVWVGSTHLLL